MSEQILVVEDDAELRRILQRSLTGWGYQVVLAADGTEALARLTGEHPPALVLLDRLMPGIDGLEVCRRIRALPRAVPPYVILLTALMASEHVVDGFAAGADDYVAKPFESEELRARVRAGLRVLELQRRLADRVAELEQALAQVKQLQGLLPICSWCKKIRDDRDYWQQVEHYVAERTDARFTHSICPECHEKHVEPQLRQLREQRAAGAPDPQEPTAS